MDINLPSKSENQIMSAESGKMSKRGKVSIIGAGPGDPELLTIKGKDRISSCDCLLYDYLVDERVLKWVREDCELICVGKRSGMHSMEQEVINRILVEQAKKGKFVVRLKGGDPFVFGRGGEEVTAIKEQGIPYEVIPGITAGIAAASSLSLPLTHREHASTLMFVTGHEDPLKKRPRIDWKSLVINNSTIVLYMGMKHLADIVDELLQAGKDPETAVAVVQWVSTPRERKHVGKLKNLVLDVNTLKLAAPSIVIIGDVLND